MLDDTETEVDDDPTRPSMRAPEVSEVVTAPVTPIVRGSRWMRFRWWLAWRVRLAGARLAAWISP